MRQNIRREAFNALGFTYLDSDALYLGYYKWVEYYHGLY